MEENIELSEPKILPTKPPDSQNDAFLPDALDPPPIFSTKWETPITKNYESSDDTKILHSVPTLPTYLSLIHMKSSILMGLRKRNQVPLLHRLKSVTTSLQLQIISMSQT